VKSASFVFIFFFPLLLAAQDSDSAGSLDLLGRYWMPQMAGTVRVEAAGFGTDIDLRRDLGMPDTNFPLGGLVWQHGTQRVRFDYTPIEYTGDQTVRRTIVFRGAPYTVGTRVVSDLQIRQLQLGWAWQFLHLGHNVRLGPMLEGDGFLLNESLAAPDLATPYRQTEKLAVGIPAAGLALDIQPRRWLDVYGQAAGMNVPGYGYFVGSDAGVRVNPSKHLDLTAGYRTFNLHVAVSPAFGSMRLRGPFVGAGLRF
jgi:hypothetical protein